MESDSGIFAITNQNFDIIRNIEAWRNNTIKEEEKNQSKQAKGDCLLADEEKEEHLSKIDSSYKNKTTLTLRKRRLFPITLTIQSSFYKNTSGTSAVKVVNSEFIQTIQMFFSFERRRKMNSLEILQALHFRYAGVYPAEKLSTVNHHHYTDDHD